jgi:hypothetical protein
MKVPDQKENIMFHHSKTLTQASICLLLLAAQAQAAELKTAAKLTFDDASTLYIADWKAARVYAVKVPAAGAAPAEPFNLRDVQKPIAKALRLKDTMLRFEDLAVQPGTGMAYVSVTAGGKAAVVSIDAAGKVRRLPTSDLKSFIAIDDAPSSGEAFWRDLPAPALTVTDMKVHDGKLYLAGLSNRNFASTLRVFDLPFNGKGRAATVEMYHPVHNQIETRAPIRAMSFATVDGVPSMVAAYTCTPLVLIPLNAIEDGAHIVGKTIGEMGWGSAPVGMVSYKLGDKEMVLLANSSRSADLMSVSDIAEQARLPGLHDPISVPDKPYAGVKGTMTPMSAVTRFDNLDDKLLLALRRDDASGAMQLVTIPKGAYLRLSDFVNEYDFRDYTYPAADKFHEYHKYWRTIEGYPELVR